MPQTFTFQDPTKQQWKVDPVTGNPVREQDYDNARGPAAGTIYTNTAVNATGTNPAAFNTGPANPYNNYALGTTDFGPEASIGAYGTQAHDTAMYGAARGPGGSYPQGKLSAQSVPQLLSQPIPSFANADASAYRRSLEGFNPSSYAQPGQQQLGNLRPIDNAAQAQNEYLGRVASGQQPGVAAQSAQSAIGQRMAGNSALAAGARGGNLAGAGRAASTANQDLRLQSQSQLEGLRASERQAAAGQLATNAAARGTVMADAAAAGVKTAGVMGEGAAAQAQGFVNLAGVAGQGEQNRYDAAASRNDASSQWLNNQYAIGAGVAPAYNNGTQMPLMTNWTPQLIGAGASALGTFGSYLIRGQNGN